MAASPNYSSTIWYTAVFGASKVKGGAKSVSTALGRCVDDVKKFMVRGTLESLVLNAPTVFSAIREYALEWLIHEVMTADGPGTGTSSKYIGVWTGSFMEALDALKLPIEATLSTVSTRIAVAYNKDEPRTERSGLISHSYGTETVGHYGEYLFPRMRNYANLPQAAADMAAPLAAFIEEVLNRFRRTYVVSAWSNSSALRSIQGATAKMHADNQNLIRVAAQNRLDKRGKKESGKK